VDPQRASDGRGGGICHHTGNLLQFVITGSVGLNPETLHLLTNAEQGRLFSDQPFE
jgi:hypothetical protein